MHKSTPTDARMAVSPVPRQVYMQTKWVNPSVFISSYQNYSSISSSLYRHRPDKDHPLHFTRTLTCDYLKNNDVINTYYQREQSWYLGKIQLFVVDCI